MTDSALVQYECRHYDIGWEWTPDWASVRGEAPGPLYYLLRHIYNNRDATIGALRSHINTLERELTDARRISNPAQI